MSKRRIAKDLQNIVTVVDDTLKGLLARPSAISAFMPVQPLVVPPFNRWRGDELVHWIALNTVTLAELPVWLRICDMQAVAVGDGAQVYFVTDTVTCLSCLAAEDTVRAASPSTGT